MVNEPLIRPYFFWWGYVGGKRGGLTSHNMSQVGFPEGPSCVPAMRKDMVPQDTLSFKRAEWVRSTNQPVTMAGDQLITLPETNKRWKITIFKRKYIYKWWIFHCHDSFREGNPHRFLLFLFDFCYRGGVIFTYQSHSDIQPTILLLPTALWHLTSVFLGSGLGCRFYGWTSHRKQTKPCRKLMGWNWNMAVSHVNNILHQCGQMEGF